MGKRNTVWGRISNVCKDLEPFNIDLNTLFYRSNDYGGNSNGSKWCWSVDASGNFTISLYLPLGKKLTKASWSLPIRLQFGLTLFQGKSAFSYGVLDLVDCR